MTTNIAPQARSFQAFNARFLSAEEVSKTFIPPPQYHSLVETNHSVLIGPRGSGKTTLLKMLQLRSLAYWKHPSASDVRDNIAFHSIFLGTDVLWGSQLEAGSKAISDSYKRAQVRRTSFRLHLSLAFLKSLADARDAQLLSSSDLSRFLIDMEDTAETALARTLAEIWLLEPSVYSLSGIRTALRAQLTRLQIIIDDLIGDPESVVPDFVKLHPVSPVISGLEETNEIIGQAGRKWAILCDELEIAPEMIRRDLFELLRSTSHSVIFKFSLFPHTTELDDLNAVNTPESGNDYQVLDLSYPYKEAAYPFCRDLFNGMIEQASGRQSDGPENVLGEGWFDGGRSSRRTTSSNLKAPNGKIYRRALKLEKQDAGFRRWLKDRGFRLNEVADLEENVQAQFRKAIPFILTRAEFVSSKGSFRSRKASTIYSGPFSLFAISEGNPRIFINLMRPLIYEYAEKGGTVSDASQTSSIDATIHRYKASLSAIPTVGKDDVQSIMQLVDVIGRFLQSDQLLEDFSPEPYSTIEVDSQVSAEIRGLVGRAINAGVFIRMPEERGAGPNPDNHSKSLVGTRLRLAYTLSPTYKLPLTVAGQSVNLSTVLHTRTAARRRKPEALTQYRLPFNAE